MTGRLLGGDLPAELSSFVGRRRELSEVRRLLSTARLVTLTGVGGVGKSRLAVRVAAGVRRAFADGVWLVELAGVSDHVLLPLAFFGALGICDQSAREPVEVLVDFLADRHLLLVVDNCEHLLPACAVLVSDLLRAASGLRMLATSRAVLGVLGERVYPVTPLEVPGGAGGQDGAASLGTRYAAVELFVDRAAAVRPEFVLAGDNATVVAEVCRRLDGIPLAIELAAARLRMLSLHQIAARLDDRFRLLTTGNRVALPRHQTLRAAIEWSYELCAEPERLLWLRASVFVDSFELSAAQRVCGGECLDDAELLDALAGLVDKSVLVAEAPTEPAGDLRYRMLETVRGYGLDRLRDAALDTDQRNVVPEADLRARHRDFYLALAEEFNADWFGPRQVTWSRRMHAEQANLRAALAYCLTAGEARTAVRLAGALYYFWWACSEAREGRYWLDRVLGADPQPSPERVRALAAHSRLLLIEGAFAAAGERARECVRLAERFEQTFYLSDGLQTLGQVMMYSGDPAAEPSMLEQAMAHARELGDNHPAVACATMMRAWGLVLHGDPAGAAEMLEEGQAICQARGEQWMRGQLLNVGVGAALALDDLDHAGADSAESLRLAHARQDRLGIGTALEYLAWIAAATGNHRRAARLLGAADQHWQAVGGNPFRFSQPHRVRQCHSASRAALGDTGFEREFVTGAAMPLDDVVAEALDAKRPAGRPRQLIERSPLSHRELSVAALVAEGLSNKAIAQRLVVSQRTAESHVQNILTKLGFTSRTQIATWYTERQR